MNEYIVGIELMQDCFSDLWTLYLTFIGILLSILTLLYSFVLSKKDELKLIAEQIKINDKRIPHQQNISIMIDVSSNPKHFLLISTKRLIYDVTKHFL